MGSNRSPLHSPGVFLKISASRALFRDDPSNEPTNRMPTGCEPLHERREKFPIGGYTENIPAWLGLNGSAREEKQPEKTTRGCNVISPGLLHFSIL